MNKIKKFSKCCAFIAFALSLTAPGIPQQIISSPVPSNSNPKVDSTITVDIMINTNGSSELLGSFTSTLKWSPSVLSFTSHSGIQGAFTGLVNSDSVSFGRLDFNGVRTQGAAGALNVFNITFKATGQQGASTNLDLEYSAMSAALTFVDLLPMLTINNAVVSITSPTSVEDLQTTPTGFLLNQNYPNPFNLETKIPYELAKQTRVSISIFNLLGKKIRALVDEIDGPGSFEVAWNGKNDNGRIVPSGNYFVEMRVGGVVQMKKVILSK